MSIRSTSAIQKAAVLLFGGGVFTSTVYLTYHWQRMEQAYKSQAREKPSNFSFVDNPCRNEQYQHVANCYDDAIGADEFYMGIKLLRRALLYFNARGTVLEVGAGTARNLLYYPDTVHRVVLVDSSDQMLNQAKQKIVHLTQQQSNTSPKPQFAVLQADSSRLNLPSHSFDSVVDTFGLCSYNDPVAVLREMARVCKPQGKILLLEHGRSHSWDFVTRHLDKHAEQHAANWGCVWNRDLDAVLAAASDDLEIEVVRKFHFGTTYYVVARPRPHSAAAPVPTIA
jgi:methyltransferase OMS1, mitochondrial